MNSWLNMVVAGALVCLLGAPVAAADDLSAARDLYAAAEYENALQLLNRLRTGELRGSDARAIEQYRAFCLLALGRPNDAEQAIAAVVVAEPTYQPSDADVSPRVRSAFSEVRRRMLPSIINEKYAAAKMAFDQKHFTAAATGFRQVLDVLGDPDVSAAASQPPLSDLRTLAVGFHELAVAAAAPPPPPAPAPEPVAVPAAPVVARVYGPDDREVLPPAVIRQALPPFPLAVGFAGQGIIEVVIDETGAVESATMRVPVSPRYDPAAVEAAREWKYRPATRNGVPVKFRKMVQISVRR
jgi:TonB family protein